MDRYDGPVKKISDTKELWRLEPEPFTATQTHATTAGPAATFNLAEFSLWQTSPQNRFLVGPGRLATAYTTALKLLADPAQLAARVAQLPPHTLEEETGVEMPQQQLQQNQQGVRANTIRNYFRPSQSREGNKTSIDRYGTYCTTVT